MAKEKTGMNRTGAHLSPKDIDKMMKNAEEDTPKSEMHNGAAIAAVRTTYISEADPLGSVLPSATLKGAMKAGMKKMIGKTPDVLIDQLGARLAFERGGVRLYEALITKYQATPEKIAGMSSGQLEHFRDEEAMHFKYVADALESLGADPTAQTPAADMVGVQAMGIMQVMDDPRTTIAQSLDALLVAELADHAGWEMLIKLADELGQDAMVSSFKKALKEEEEHLSHVRQWVENSMRRELH